MLASSSLQSIEKDRNRFLSYKVVECVDENEHCDGNLKEAPPLLQGVVVEMRTFLKGVKAKVSSEGQEIILKKEEGYLGLGDSMCKEHEQRELGI